jgi:hypothetical protein
MCKLPKSSSFKNLLRKKLNAVAGIRTRMELFVWVQLTYILLQLPLFWINPLYLRVGGSQFLLMDRQLLTNRSYISVGEEITILTMVTILTEWCQGCSTNMVGVTRMHDQTLNVCRGKNHILLTSMVLQYAPSSPGRCCGGHCGG